MAIVSLENNPYYQKALQNFLSVNNEINQMENDFRPNMIDTYKAAQQEQLKTAAQLLKFGVSFTLKDNCICIEIDDEEYAISENLLKEFMGDDFAILLEAKENNENTNFSACEDTTSCTDEQFDAGSPSMNTYSYPGMEWSQNGRLSTPVINPYMPMNFMNPFLAMLYHMAGYNGANYIITDPRNTQPQHMQSQPVPMHQKSASKKNANDSSSDILSDFSKMQKKIILLEQERDNAKSKLTAEKEKNEALNEKIKESEATYLAEKETAETQISQLIKENESFSITNQSLSETISSLETQISVLQEDISSVSEALSKKEEVVMQRQSDIELLISQKNALEEKISSIQMQKEESEQKHHSIVFELQKSAGQNERQIKQYKDRISELEGEILSTQKDFSDKESKIRKDFSGKQQDYEKRIETLEKQLSAAKEQSGKDGKKAEESIKQQHLLKSEKESLETESKRLKKENEDLKKKNQKLQESYENQKSLCDSLKKEADAMRTLAFFDEKSGTKNSNAFNAEFASIPKSGLVLAMISICGTKNVNATYGQAIGDQFIATVANTLNSAFTSDNVYRYMGDQFIVIIRNSNYNTAQSQLAKIKEALAGDQINIVFGISVGNNCNNHAEILDAARNMLNQAKKISAPAPSVETSQNTLTAAHVASPMETASENEAEEIDVDAAVESFISNNMN